MGGLGGRYGVHPMTVTAQLKRAGFDLARRLMTEDEVTATVKLYQEG